MRVGDRVRWYNIAFGTEVDVHTAHWHGGVVNLGAGPTPTLSSWLRRRPRWPTCVQTIPARGCCTATLLTT
jgi:hypothetical protein